MVLCYRLTAIDKATAPEWDAVVTEFYTETVNLMLTYPPENAIGRRRIIRNNSRSLKQVSH